MTDEEESERLLKEKADHEAKLNTLRYELWRRYLKEFGFNPADVERSGLPGA